MERAALLCVFFLNFENFDISKIWMKNKNCSPHPTGLLDPDETDVSLHQVKTCAIFCFLFLHHPNRLFSSFFFVKKTDIDAARKLPLHFLTPHTHTHTGAM